MDQEKIQEEITKANFSLLKVSLYNYIKKNFKVCDGFLIQLNSCVDEAALTKLFISYNDDVYEKLGGDPNLEDDIRDLEREIESLEHDIEVMEGELEDAQVVYGNTLDDEFKRGFIEQYYKNYTPWEMEELLKNGKELLKK